MALYKQIEFAKLCGISRANLSTYKGRGKIILTNDLVDDSIAQNADFLKKMQERNGIEPAPTPPPAAPTHPRQPPAAPGRKRQPPTETDNELLYSGGGPDEIPFTGVIEPGKKKKPARDATHDASIHLLEKQQKTLQIEKTKEEIELLRKKKYKIEGETIPTDLVKTAFAQHFKSVSVAFKNSLGKMLQEITKQKNFTRAEAAELRGKMMKFLNVAIQDSVDESKKSINNLVMEYSNKKDVGERE